MSSERVQTALLAALLLAVGVAAWAFQLRPPLEVDPRPLAALPRSVDGWESVDVPLEDTVERILRADFNLQRAYVHPLGGLVWFYVGYYGTDRGGRSDHTPQVCYASAGWTIVEGSERVIELGPRMRANEMLVERDGKRRLVQFWFQSHRDTGMVNALDQTLDRLFGRLLDGRADGAFVRISTPLDSGGETGARTRLMSLGSRLEPLISAHWPLEHPEGEPVEAGPGSRARNTGRLSRS